MKFIKKATALCLSYMMSTTLVFAQHTRTAAEAREFEQVLSSLDQISQQDVENFRGQRTQIAMIDAALADREIAAMTYEEFKQKMLRALERSQGQQERVATRIMSPRGIVEGRRQARHERRMQRFMRKLEKNLGQEVARDQAETILDERMDVRLQQENRETLAAALENHDSASSFLNAAKQDLLNRQVVKTGDKKISRSIATESSYSIIAVWALPFLVVGAALSLVGGLGHAGVLAMASGAVIATLTLGIILVLFWIIVACMVLPR